MTALTVLLLCVGSWAQPAAPSAHHEIDGQDATFKTQDGWAIEGKYLPAKNSHVVVLVPGRGQTIEHWYMLAQELAQAGYGYLAIDLRGHGQSNIGPDGLPHSFHEFKTGKTQNDWDDMRFDVQAAFDWLKSQGVSEDHLGVVGDDVGGSVGLKFAAVHPNIAVFVWLSPGMSWQEVLSVNAMRAYKRPILMIYSELDKRSARETPVLYNIARLSGGDISSWAFGVPKVQGFKLAHYGPVVHQIIGWLDNPVKPAAPAVSTPTETSSSPGEQPEDLGPPTPAPSSEGGQQPGE